MTFRQQYRSAREFYRLYLALAILSSIISGFSFQVGEIRIDCWWFGAPICICGIAGTAFSFRAMRKAKDYIVFDKFLDNIK